MIYLGGTSYRWHEISRGPEIVRSENKWIGALQLAQQTWRPQTLTDSPHFPPNRPLSRDKERSSDGGLRSESERQRQSALSGKFPPVVE